MFPQFLPRQLHYLHSIQMGMVGMTLRSEMFTEQYPAIPIRMETASQKVRAEIRIH
jgi:hypothetical protein